jgi:DNA-binding NarL/FixJ family response regulator
MWLGSAGTRYGVALDLADLELRDALVEALESHPALAEAPPGAAPDVIVSDHAAAPPNGAAVLRLGGPLPADAPPDLILSAAHLLAAGLRLDPSGAAEARQPPRLSPREREVLALLVDGAPNKAIARALGISVRTAKFHVTALLGKLHARNRAEAVAIALREGLVVL